MAGTHNIYGGADYGLDGSKYDSEFLGMNYKTPASNISMAVDPRTANQLSVVSAQLNTGAKGIEVQLAMNEVAESIPNQHLDELNRLRKLIGAEFTVHGALLEPTGVTKQGWDDTQRQQIERQMWTSLQRAKRVDPDGNVVVTFHSSNGLPEPETKVIDENFKVDGIAKERTTSIMTVDERTGQFGNIQATNNPFEGKEKYISPLDQLKEKNKEAWADQMSRIAHTAHIGGSAIEGASRKLSEGIRSSEDNLVEIKDKSLGELYNLSKSENGQKMLREVVNSEAKKVVNDVIHDLNYGEIYVREAYNQLQNSFNIAWDTAKRNPNNESLKKLEKLRDEIKSKVDYINKPEKLPEFSEALLKGIDTLNNIYSKEAPEIIRPLKEWAVDKAAETFSNLATKAYKEFKDKAPIISIENPPAGSGLSRAEDLRAVIEESRKKFVENLKKEGMSESSAKNQAEKLIGATWDVGHINMIKKFGYDDKALAKQTETIGKFVKHVHLSDNFGMEHTELPMGMGNVPTKAHMDILDKYNDKLKKVVETGTWYQYFKTPPLAETLSAMGSPVYSMQMGPSWNNVYGRTTSPYFSGYGMNPDIHHSIYGSGFANLPVELGGQMQGRSRMSGNPME